jgi:serine/threonine protein kinase
MNLAAHKHHKLFGFTLREQLESGKWGATYLGVDESTETEVEIKIIDALSGISSNVREQIIQEVDAQLTLNHPAIVKLLNVDIEENLLCLVFERVNGQSLNQAIKLRGPLSVDEALELFGQVLSAIHHVHSLGIIHRQLTTSNIFIQKEGTLKICNFGVANSRGFQYYKSAGHSPIKNEISCQSDIYSLSIILLELLSGTLLANHGSLNTIPADLDFQESLLNEPSEILAVLGDVPASVSTAISKALLKLRKIDTLLVKNLLKT